MLWANLYETNGHQYLGHGYSTQDEADQAASLESPRRIFRVRVTLKKDLVSIAPAFEAERKW